MLVKSANNFTEPNIAFNDDVEYEDLENGDIANNQSKQCKIKINTSQDCKNLILKVKNALYESNIIRSFLFFIFPELHNDIHLKLRSIYNEMKLEYSKQEKDGHEEYQFC
ncbi:hypothetical protein RhiirC2_798270 [Rhizophagus irregularis]|uniref:Uncharacterized protein n=1 Tax=Rhizophagus irregularis TaxID=588596 RepID=A0A2N1M6P7_9GLOM|nr:hypothetical protein RhiirC2_798270 [Rhizophagus irregularis]